jgi:hypothetical protein
VILGFEVRFQEPGAGSVLGSMPWVIMSFVTVHGDWRSANGKFLEARMAFMTPKGSSNSIGDSKLVCNSRLSDLSHAGFAVAAAAEDCADSKDSSRGGPDAAAAAEDCTDSTDSSRGLPDAAAAAEDCADSKDSSRGGPDAAAAAEDCTDSTDSSRGLPDAAAAAEDCTDSTDSPGSATFEENQMGTELMGTEAGTSRLFLLQA